MSLAVTVTGLHDRVRAFAAERVPGLRGAACVLAASGGADSSAMVALLIDAGLLDVKCSVIAHFDHRLRDADEARADLSAVQALADRFGLPLETGCWDDPRTGEQAARVARYSFLRDIAERRGCGAVVTGHTADDQAETLVMRMARGSGLFGMRGMAADAPWPIGGRNLRVWRPLLSLTRNETRAYCAARGVDFHDDTTNAEPSSLRNVVRLRVLPELERSEPDVRDALLRLAEDARLAVSTMERAVTGVLVERSAAEVRLHRATLRRLADGERACAFRLAVASIVGDAREYERRHYAIMAHAIDAQTGAAFDLPRGVVLTVDADVIVLSNGAPAVDQIPAEFEAAVPFRGTVGGWNIAVERGGATVLPAEAVVRRRRPGDRIRPSGLGGTRKLHDVLIDRKVPRRERDAMPVIAIGSQVLWTILGAAEPWPEQGPRFTIRANLR